MFLVIEARPRENDVIIGFFETYDEAQVECSKNEYRFIQEI